MWNVHASGETKEAVIAKAKEQLGDVDQADIVLALIASKVNALADPDDHQSIDIYSSGSSVLVEATLRTVSDGVEAKPRAAKPQPAPVPEKK